MRAAIPPAFRLPAGAQIRIASVEADALRALLDHRADAEQMGVLDVVVETAIRALDLAPKRPQHCAHLDPDMLAQAMRVMHRGAHALRHARTRHEATGVYGLDAADRQAVMDVGDWYAALNARGAIPRAIWLSVLMAASRGRGIKLIPLADL